MSGDVHVRFCEGLGVKFPRATQPVTEPTGCRFEIRDQEAVINFYGDFNILQGVLDKLGVRQNQ